MRQLTIDECRYSIGVLDMAPFPDHMHVEKIRDALWRRPEFGQAAVLVGAGFSRNAEPASIGAPPFPLWADLGKCLVDRLYPQGLRSTDYPD